jgi:hypothetical protein
VRGWLDPKYVDVAVQRWQSFAGAEATLEGTGETFAEVTAARHSATTAALVVDAEQGDHP